MATAYHNLSDYDFNSVPNAENMRFGIVVSEWNNNITGPLLEGAISTLKKHGAKDKNILVQTVPGSFELTFGSAQMIKSGKVDAVIAIGCVVRFPLLPASAHRRKGAYSEDSVNSFFHQHTSTKAFHMLPAVLPLKVPNPVVFPTLLPSFSICKVYLVLITGTQWFLPLPCNKEALTLYPLC